jgi:UDP-glucose:O-linked fucose beta-1,3-glucosyltransferase
LNTTSFCAGFKHSQEIFKLRQEEKTLQAEISGAQVAIKNLTSKIGKLDQEAIQQRTLIYNQEYILQQLERKVKRAQGVRTDEEREILDGKIKDLTQKFDAATASHALLSSQLKRSQDDLRHAKRKFEVLTREKGRVGEQIDDLNLYLTSAANQLAVKVKEKEEVMVEESILRLEVKKLRGFMHARADEVLSLEGRQLQLQLALEERTQEIEIHKGLLRAQIRAAEEERYTVNHELRTKTAQSDRMKTRYEILMAQISGGADIEEENSSAPDAGEKTQGYFIIRAAQERESLQRQGDELDAKIQRAEREIEAMDNTLNLLNSKNSKFKSQLDKTGISNQDLEHRDYLQAQLDSAIAKCAAKRDELAALEQEMMQAEQKLAAANECEGIEQQMISHLESNVHALSRQLDDLRSKKLRAEQMVTRLAKELRRLRGISGSQITDEELDIKIRAVREMSNFVLYKMDEVFSRTAMSISEGAATSPLTKELITNRAHQLLQELGVDPPSRPLTRQSDGGASPTSVANAFGQSPTRLQGNSRYQTTPTRSPPHYNAVGAGNGARSTLLSLQFDAHPHDDKQSRSQRGESPQSTTASSRNAARLRPERPRGKDSGTPSPVHGGLGTLPLLPISRASSRNSVTSRTSSRA